MARSFTSRVTVDTKKLRAIVDAAPIEVVDAAARELGAEMLKCALQHLDRQVYTRPNLVVTMEKMETATELTGALWNSGYLVTHSGDLPAGAQSESEAEAAARGKNPGVEFGTAPPGPDRAGQAQVLFAVEYALKVELGSAKVAARPYLQPARDEVQGLVTEVVQDKMRDAGFG